MHRHNSVRVYPYSHSWQMMVLVQKLFLYKLHGCGMQSERVCSLNHDTTTSLRLSNNQLFKNLYTLAHESQWKGAPYAHLQHMNNLNYTLWMLVKWMWEPFCVGLRPQPMHQDIISSPAAETQAFGQLPSRASTNAIWLNCSPAGWLPQHLSVKWVKRALFTLLLRIKGVKLSFAQ
jgi:hypothetical protein